MLRLAVDEKLAQTRGKLGNVMASDSVRQRRWVEGRPPLSRQPTATQLVSARIC